LNIWVGVLQGWIWPGLLSFRFGLVLVLVVSFGFELSVNHCNNGLIHSLDTKRWEERKEVLIKW
jgi:hypothetical protein